MSLDEACANPSFPLPIGSIFPYMGGSQFVPSTFLICDGRAVKQTDYPELYSVIGGAFNGNGLVAAGDFLLPKLNDSQTYIIPNRSLKTDPTQSNGIIPPYLHTSDALPLIADTNIPTIAANKFSYTYPTEQVGLQGRTMNARGDYTGDRYAASDTGSSSPAIVALNSSNEGGGQATMTGANYSFYNPSPQKIGDIKLNTDHEVNYGGMTCLWLIKAFSSYDGSSTTQKGIVEQAEQEEELRAEQAAEKSARDAAEDAAEQIAVAKAQAEEAAIAAGGQGGGTTIPYQSVLNLSGFVISADPQY